MQPEQLGPFRIGRILGRGGMGAVYEGFNEQTDEHVAVKVLLSTLEEDEDVRRRFEAEIDTLKRLRHPNIVRLFGFGEEQNLLYYVMELVDGASLHQEIRKKRLFEWHEVAKIGLEMCFALKHGHDRGITHRDIKPANILLNEQGEIKLSDYGIAQFFGAQQRLTEVHSVVGTLEYMSPEQAVGLPVGPRSDIYSLGAVLYTLLAGRPPYSAKNLIDIVRKHQSNSFESIRAERIDVPDEMEAIVFDLLKSQPEERPHNAYLIAKRFQSMLQALVGPPEMIHVKPTHSEAPGRKTTDSSDFPASDQKKTKPPIDPRRDAGIDDSVIDLVGIPTNSHEADPSQGNSGELGVSTSLANSFGLRDDQLGPTRIHVPDSSDDIESTRFLLADSVAKNSSSPGDSPEPSVDRSGECDDFVLNDGVPIPIPDDVLNTDENTKQLSSRIDMKSDLNSNPQSRLRENEKRQEAAGSEDLPESNHSGDAMLPKTDEGIDPGSDRKIRLLSDPAIDEAEAKRAEPTVRGLKDSPGPAKKGAASDPKPYALQNPEPSVKRGSPENMSVDSEDETTAKHLTTSRFVKVGEHELDDYDSIDREPKPIISVQTILASVSLIFIGVLIWYFLQPVSPDALYDRIKKTLDINDDSFFQRKDRDLHEGESPELSPRALRHAAADIDSFLKQYANHPKADMVRYLEDQLELVNKERQLERYQQFSGPQKLIPVERAFLEAIATVKTDPEKTMTKLRALIDLYDSDKTNYVMNEELSEQNQSDARLIRPRQRLSRSEQCIEVARQRLKKLESDFAAIQIDQINLLKQRLADANQIEEKDPIRADKIRIALIQLYENRSWADELIKQAKDDLKDQTKERNIETKTE